MNATKLQCFTTASWLRGYASSLDEYKHQELIHKLNQAANLLAQMWEEYADANGYGDTSVPNPPGSWVEVGR